MDWENKTTEDLEAAVRYHNWKYWVEATPEISDYEYDRLIETLRVRNPDSPVLDQVGEAGAVSADGERHELGDKVTHQRPMLSLDKCYSDEDLHKWYDKFEGGAVASPKIDGVACSLRYDASGRLELAATRGNGRVGELITNNIRHVEQVPEALPVGPVEVRGELYMPLSVFREEFAEQFANPRNLTAGAIKQKDPTKTAGYRLRFLAYDLDSEADLHPETELDKARVLSTLGFTPVDSIYADRDDGPATYQQYLAQRDAFDYETDGVVFRANQVAEQARMGATSHHPRYALAYKFQGDSAASVLREVEWSVSRTGAINPVAIVDPVVLSGASVTRASLHNLGIMEKLGGEAGLTVGSRVLMMRRGGVIPHVEQVLERGDGQVTLPDVCPFCEGPAFRQEDILMAEHRPSCSATRLGILQHFVKVIEAKGFGPKLLLQLIESELIEEPADFFEISVDQLLTLERVGTKLAEKLVSQIDARRQLPLNVVLTALGIDELGPVVARTIAEALGTLEALREATAEQLAEIHGVGEVIAKNVVDGLVSHADALARLTAHVAVLAVEKPPEPEAGGALEGLSFLFTGTLESMKRKEAQAVVQALGGRAPSAVAASLTHLVLGDGDLERFNNGWRSSKLKKVEKLNGEGAEIRVIGETEFLALTVSAE